MNGTAPWLADRVASLLPKVTAEAAVIWSECDPGAACSIRTLFQCHSLNGRVWCSSLGVCC
jgi:hypothetical protein